MTHLLVALIAASSLSAGISAGSRSTVDDSRPAIAFAKCKLALAQRDSIVGHFEDRLRKVDLGKRSKIFFPASTFEIVSSYWQDYSDCAKNLRQDDSTQVAIQRVASEVSDALGTILSIAESDSLKTKGARLAALNAAMKAHKKLMDSAVSKKLPAQANLIKDLPPAPDLVGDTYGGDFTQSGKKLGLVVGAADASGGSAASITAARQMFNSLGALIEGKQAEREVTKDILTAVYSAGMSALQRATPAVDPAASK